MKTYEEMARNALERIEQEEKNMENNRKKAAKIAVPAVCLCIIAVLTFGILHTGSFSESDDISLVPGETSAENTTKRAAEEETTASTAESVNENETEEAGTVGDALTEPEAGTVGDALTDPSVSVTQAVTQAVTQSGSPVEPTQDRQGQKGSDVVDSALINWKNNMCISASLYEAMVNDPDGAYTVTASYRPATAEITDFVYEGKTLSEWAVASEDARFMLQKMHELLKQGEELKYGTALYETGLPDGTKWDRRLYEDKVAYYGELIDKYIVNGEFLHEQLSKDIAEYDTETDVGKYKLAYNAYLETVLPSAMQNLTQGGISCSRAAYSVNGITFTVTQTQLENIPLDDITNWFFDLAENGQKGVVTQS